MSYALCLSDSCPISSLHPFVIRKLRSELCDHHFHLALHQPSALDICPTLHTLGRAGAVAPSWFSFCSCHLLHSVLCDDFPHLTFSDVTSTGSPASSHQPLVFFLEISGILPLTLLSCYISPVILNGKEQPFKTGTLLSVKEVPLITSRAIGIEQNCPSHPT